MVLFYVAATETESYLLVLFCAGWFFRFLMNVMVSYPLDLQKKITVH